MLLELRGAIAVLDKSREAVMKLQYSKISEQLNELMLELAAGAAGHIDKDQNQDDWSGMQQWTLKDIIGL